MASAAHGCPVLAVDAQPGCKQWFEAARAANHANASQRAAAFFSPKRVRIVTRPISQSTAPIEIDKWACWVMHKIDKKAKRRRPGQRSAPPPPPPPPPLTQSTTAEDSAWSHVALQGEELLVREGAIAVRPMDSTELLRMLPPPHRILLAKVDTEGAELSVMSALEPMLPRIANLLVELAPGWWSLYTNRTARAGEGRGKRQGAHAARSSAVALSLDSRVQGADQLSRLLGAEDLGGHGFQAALTSTGKYFANAERFRDYIIHMGSNGYWNQADIWLSRDAALVRRAQHLICMRQQAGARARAACVAAERQHERRRASARAAAWRGAKHG
jgi:hypothetical protein